MKRGICIILALMVALALVEILHDGADAQQPLHGPPLALAQPAVQHRHPVAEHGPEAPGGLGGQGDLRHQDNRASVHRQRGFYRSLDRGESWERRNEYISGGTGPHYYQELYASPHHEGRIYLVSNTSQISDDGGATMILKRAGDNFRGTGRTAIDQHDDRFAAGLIAGTGVIFTLASSFLVLPALLLVVYKKINPQFHHGFIYFKSTFRSILISVCLSG